jgi:hypothetical protein
MAECCKGEGVGGLHADMGRELSPCLLGDGTIKCKIEAGDGHGFCNGDERGGFARACQSEHAQTFSGPSVIDDDRLLIG